MKAFIARHQDHGWKEGDQSCLFVEEWALVMEADRTMSNNFSKVNRFREGFKKKKKLVENSTILALVGIYTY